jgi:hypothetical protein
MRAALLTVAIALLAAGCGSGSKGSAQGFHRTFTPVGARPRARARFVLPPGPGSLIAQVLVGTALRSRPGGPTLASIGPRTQWDSPDVLEVVEIHHPWIGVRSEFAGNGRLGWIPLSAVVLGRDPWSVRASLSGRFLKVFHDRREVADYTVGIGAAGSPTPTGRFAVTDRLVTNDPEGPYGCCIVALTATAPHAIAGWTGGNRIAVHATPDTETIGQPDSHGCLHVSQSEARWLILHVPDGTPVTISA